MLILSEACRLSATLGGLFASAMREERNCSEKIGMKKRKWVKTKLFLF
jgi:hypothetical protein